MATTKRCVVGKWEVRIPLEFFLVPSNVHQMSWVWLAWVFSDLEFIMENFGFEDQNPLGVPLPELKLFMDNLVTLDLRT